MEAQLQQTGRRVVGSKQVLRALSNGIAATVFLAKDADEFIYRRIEAACEQANVPVIKVDTMQELGKKCLVGVKTAAAAALK